MEWPKMQHLLDLGYKWPTQLFESRTVKQWLLYWGTEIPLNCYAHYIALFEKANMEYWILLQLKELTMDFLCRENRITLWGKITSMHVYPHATCDNDESIHDTYYVLQFCLPLQLTAACYLQIDMFVRMCNCKERKGHCCHMLCLLYNACHFIMMEFKSVPLVVSKTSLTQIWHIP